MFRCVLCVLAFALVSLQTPEAFAQSSRPRELLEASRRIVFLGDSITAAGQYVGYFDAWLLSQPLPHRPKVIDAGLPSETVSGLSEEGHAGGKFPRPDLAERLDRVLAATKPDLVIACYGINCGIYQPFDEERFQSYQQGMRRLKTQVEKSGAKFIVMAPPFYDDMRSPRPFSYNAVLDRYSDWLLEQRKHGWEVIDLHGPMTREVEKRRTEDPKFTFQPDGVHPNDAGHWFIAQQLIRWFGDEQSAAAETPQEMLAHHQLPETLLPLVRQRVTVLRDAYVAAAGHKRPGVAKGLPVAEAEQQAGELTQKIASLVGKPVP
jgi:lysophospholipase L1-like esterase